MNYLVYRNDGLGDLILSTPLLVNIRNFDHKAKNLPDLLDKKSHICKFAVRKRFN